MMDIQLTEPLTITAVITMTVMLLSTAKHLMPRYIKGREEVIVFGASLIITGVMKYSLGEFASQTPLSLLMDLLVKTFIGGLGAGVAHDKALNPLMTLLRLKKAKEKSEDDT